MKKMFSRIVLACLITTFAFICLPKPAFLQSFVSVNSTIPVQIPLNENLTVTYAFNRMSTLLPSIKVNNKLFDFLNADSLQGNYLSLAIADQRKETTESGAAQAAASTEDLQSAFNQLIGKAKTEGTVRIIVGLPVEFKTENKLNNLQVRKQHSDIKSAQQNVLEKLKPFRAENIKRFDFIPFMAMEVDANTLEFMQNSGDFTSIQEDQLNKSEEISDEANLAESTAKINAQFAWNAGFTGDGRYIAILSNGVDKNHPFLSGKVVSEACYSSNYTNADSLCPGGVTESTSPNSALPVLSSVSGTLYAGIAAGKGAAFSGVAKDAKIIAIQFYTKITSQSFCGSSNPCLGYYLSDLIKGLERVYALGTTSYNTDAALINGISSDQYTANCDAANTPLKTAIDNLRFGARTATVINSGNSGNNNSITSPACVSTVISVGATTDSDGILPTSNSASFLSLLAPGQFIKSSVPGGGYASYTGTGVAAPHVAGAFAILKKSIPNASVSQVLTALQNTGKPITDPRNGITKKRIDVGAALGTFGTDGCAFNLNSTSANVAKTGGSGAISLTTTSQCWWAAVSEVPWITVSTGGTPSRGFESGTINYTVAANTGTQPRTGKIRISGQIFTVTQASDGYPVLICHSVRGGISVGTFIPYDVTGTSAVTGAQITRRLNIQVLADSATLGSCMYPENSNSGDVERFVVGTNVLIKEVVPANIIVSNILFNDGQDPFADSTLSNPAKVLLSSSNTFESVFPNPDKSGGRAIISVRNYGNKVLFVNNKFTPTKLKICKIAGAGVIPGTPFTFDVKINAAASEPEITLPVLTVTAGQSGNCAFAQGPYSSNGGNEFLNAGQTVTVTERAVAGYQASAITSTTGNPAVNLTARTAAMTLVASDPNVLTFINSSTSPSTPKNGRIAFSSNLSDPNNNTHIFTMNPDGSDLKKLTNAIWLSDSPAFSSDGTKIVFRSLRQGDNGAQIYVMNSDGSNQTRLTTDAAEKRSPSFSPDGTKIVYYCASDICVMNANGTSQVNLTNSAAFDDNPSFSPDGTKILFESVANNSQEVFIMSADGSNRTNLTNNPSYDGTPAFSPDGSKIIFITSRDPQGQLYIMNANGSNQTRLLTNPTSVGKSMFSPDGSQIVFDCTSGSNQEICVIDSNGTNLKNITNNTFSDYYPAWQPVFTTVKPKNGKIFFYSNRDNGNYEIYSMNPDGSDQTNLTKNSALDIEPASSSDGTKIVFRSLRQGDNGAQIYLMNSDGSNQTRLTSDAAEKRKPSFSPDGSKIVYYCAADICVMKSDGTNQVNLTNSPSFENVPVFSPDGSKIAFESTRDGSQDVFIMDADGSNLKNLSNNPYYDGTPSFSPDGSKIVFFSGRDNNNGGEIYVMNVDGTSQTRLTNVSGDDYAPVFSPDGGKISFTSQRDGNSEIYLMDANGSFQYRLTNNSSQDEEPSWQPSFTTTSASNGKIAFARGYHGDNPGGNTDIYIMNPDGTGQTKLTSHLFNGRDTRPAFSSDGSRIVFVRGHSAETPPDGYEIYVMNSDGSNQTRLTNNFGRDDDPSFSFDGRKIVFTSKLYHGYDYGDIKVMNADGSNQTNLTNNGSSNSEPAFSLDGTKIVFISKRDNANGEIYVMNADGTNQTRLTNNALVEANPSFSSDGTKILFGRSGTPYKTYSINLDGTGETLLTNNADVSRFEWSPDGKKMVVVKGQAASDKTIQTVNFDGSNLQQLTSGSPTNAGDEDDFPAWQPIAVNHTTFTPAQQNVSVAPISSLNMNFSNVLTGGNTTVTALLPNQLQPLPANFSLGGSSLMYNIVTSAAFSGEIKITFNVPNVASEAACLKLKILHFTNNTWDSSNNSTPVYDGVNKTCTVSQTVTSLSPFVVAEYGGGTYTISGQITNNGNPMPNVTVSLSGTSNDSKLTDSSGNYSFPNLSENGNYTVTPSLANYTFNPPSATFNNLIANQTAVNFSAAQCSYSLSPNGVNAPAAGGTASFTVTVAQGCPWTASTTDGWITVTAPASGDGNGTVSYSLMANTEALRTGKITVAGQHFIITQPGAPASIAGTVSYGIYRIEEPADKFVPGVSMAISSASAPVATGISGDYLLDNLSIGGTYTVTPSKTGNVNGITAFDATLVLRCVAAGNNCALTINQRKAADSDNDNIVSSFDATQILRFVAANSSNANTGNVGKWKFDPVSLPYPNLNGNMTGENYTAFLTGEVDGDWAPPTPPTNNAESNPEPNEAAADGDAALSETEAFLKQKTENDFEAVAEASAKSKSETIAKNDTIAIPVRIENTGAPQLISSYSFGFLYDPRVLQPAQDNPVEIAETLSGDFAVVADVSAKGKIGIAAAGGGIAPGSAGTLVYLRFNVVGKTGKSEIPLTLFENPVFQDGEGNRLPFSWTNNSFSGIRDETLTSVDGRVAAGDGRGIRNAVVSISDSEGNVRTTLSSTFGYYRFDQVRAGENYQLAVSSKRFVFGENKTKNFIGGKTNSVDFYSEN